MHTILTIHTTTQKKTNTKTQPTTPACAFPLVSFFLFCSCLVGWWVVGHGHIHSSSSSPFFTCLTSTAALSASPAAKALSLSPCAIYRIALYLLYPLHLQVWRGLGRRLGAVRRVDLGKQKLWTRQQAPPSPSSPRAAWLSPGACACRTWCRAGRCAKEAACSCGTGGV